MITPRVKLETQSFTYVSRNTGKEELVNLNENQLNALREFYVERFVDNMDTRDLVQYVSDDMQRYMEALPDNEVIDECLNYWDDMFDEIVEEIKEIEGCEFLKTLDDKKEEYLESLSEGKDVREQLLEEGFVPHDTDDYCSKVDALVDSMGVTDKEVSTIHRRKDLDLL